MTTGWRIGFAFATTAVWLATPPFILSYPDPLVAVVIMVSIWVAIALTFLFASQWTGWARGRNAVVRMYQGGACKNQLPDYMATNNYFNQQAMRRDLDKLANIAEQEHIQNTLDHLK